ncbi:hypothetical protein COM24_01600 [Bacillus toyonensis]|uniref:hypothetical protein n=1 Tax=Bacillus toyonensis TaxID=155322 RepID=UPI000BF4680B|nr:hypothetical protein [Bacillus toyonensis]PGC59233.1 hypothetical protein COM24_01600 [Bacillus toyonensis]
MITIEDEWMVENKEKLDEKDIKKLNKFNYFEMIKKGEIHLNAYDFIQMYRLVHRIYKKHTK